MLGGKAGRYPLEQPAPSMPLGAVGTVGACSKDATSAWRFQNLTRALLRSQGAHSSPHYLCVLLGLDTGIGSRGNTTEPCLCPGCSLEK